MSEAERKQEYRTWLKAALFNGYELTNSMEMLKNEPNSHNHPGSSVGLLCEIKMEDVIIADPLTVMKIEKQPDMDMFKEEEPYSDSDAHPVSSLDLCDVKKEESAVQNEFTVIKNEDENKTFVTGRSKEETNENIFTTDDPLKVCHSIQADSHPVGSENQLKKPQFIHNHNLFRNPNLFTYVCDICHKSFPSKRRLAVHQVVHSAERPFPCDKCNKTFRYKNNLKEHSFHHTGERPFVCDTCKKSFYSSSCFSEHKLLHNDGCQYECNICDKKFKTKMYLKTHQLIHTGEYNLICDVCRKSFSSELSLKRHKIVHTDERPYSCNICNRAFKYKDSLDNHQLKHSCE